MMRPRKREINWIFTPSKFNIYYSFQCVNNDNHRCLYIDFILIKYFSICKYHFLAYHL